MKIHKINIRNFKGFAERSFNLNEHFTVFIGENATGKTSVLDALAVALSSFFLGIEEISSRTIRPNEIHTIIVDGQTRLQKPVIIEACGKIDQIDNLIWRREITRTNTTSKDANQLRDIVKQKLIESRKPKGNRDETKITFPVIAYHGTGRLWASHEKIGFQKQEEGIKMAYTNCLSEKSSPKEFLSWYKTQEDSVKKFEQPLDIAHLNAFKRTILDLIPDDRWQDIAFDRKQEELMGIFTDANGQKHKLAYSQLSDGFRNIIGIAADIAYRCIQLNPHLGEVAVIETPGVVLIDELDVHLHPNWQRDIVGNFKRIFPNIQFVATTHSPFIVQSLEADELINLDSPISLEEAGLQPVDLTLNQVATEIMQVENLNSDNFEERFDQAKEVFQNLNANGHDISMDDYSSLKQLIDGLVMIDTEDPVYKAYLTVKNAHE